jgi:sugar lactone lactonase YvrE
MAVSQSGEGVMRDSDAVRVAVHTRTRLGEGPHWAAGEDSVYWVDILGHQLHRLHLASGQHKSWPMPEPICWLVERADGDGWLAGFASGMARLTLDPLSIGPITPLAPMPPDHRLNDAKVDRAGRLWAGVMQNEGAAPTGSLYRVAGGQIARADDGYLVPNGPAISVDGAWLYHADSPRRVIYRFAIAADGTLHDRHIHVRFADDWGVPDGMTVDAEGHLWVAHWDGGCVSRFDPDGQRVRVVPVPASRPTSPCFGGAGLDRLFVTSAADGCDGEPLAGALFEIDAGVAGLPPVPFAG